MKRSILSQPVPIVVGLLAGLAACADPQAVAPSARSREQACVLCHGDAADGSGAPPRDLGGRTTPTAPGVGAHRAHVEASRGAAACLECHPDPRAGSRGHLNARVDVVFGPLATAEGAVPRLDGTTAPTCSNVYCHGAFPGGNAANAPTWTRVDGTQAACGTCHGDASAPIPSLPRTLHARLADGSTPATCNVCHPGTVGPAGELLVAGGQHVDGAVQVDPEARHPAGWASGTSHGIAAAGGVTACLRCHAAKTPAQVTSLTCASCHDALAGGADWTTTCNTCHGSSANAAPPRDTRGNTSTQARGVGAHQSHVTAAHGIALPIDCVFCHPKPGDVLAPGHLDGHVTAAGYTGSDPQWLTVGRDLGWDPASATCTNHCHGSTMPGGPVKIAVWTAVDGSFAACDTCHLFAPVDGPVARDGFDAHSFHTWASRGLSCGTCHTGYDSGGSGIVPRVNTALHVNGRRDVVLDLDGTVIQGWDCTGCHNILLP